MRPHITDWLPNRSTAHIYHIDKELICINIDRYHMIPDDKLEKSGNLFMFHNIRKLFKKELNTILNYIDYFIEFYDNDDELMPIYIALKCDIELNELDNPDICKKRILGYLFSKSNLKDKIIKLVDDNYHLDLTKIGDKEFIKDSDFTNDDGKIILSASMMMKLSVPILAHITSTNKSINIEERHTFICDIFIDIFYKMCGEEAYISIIDKLYQYISCKVGYHSTSHELMWDMQGAIGGWTESNLIDSLLYAHILYLNLFKLNFKDNLMAFIKAIIESQLNYNVSRVKHKKNIISINRLYESIPNVLANIDKWEQFMVKMDESELILSELSIKYMLEFYETTFGCISDDEIEYYMTNMKLKSKFHSDLIFSAVAKDFMGYRDVYNMDIRNYVKLIIINKRRLTSYMYTVLPIIISANIEGRINSNLVKSTKFIKSIENSSVYKNLMMNSYSSLKNDVTKENYILELIKILLTSKFTYVEFNNKDLLGERIQFDPTIAVDELLTFIDTI